MAAEFSAVHECRGDPAAPFAPFCYNCTLLRPAAPSGVLLAPNAPNRLNPVFRPRVVPSNQLKRETIILPLTSTMVPRLATWRKRCARLFGCPSRALLMVQPQCSNSAATVPLRSRDGDSASRHAYTPVAWTATEWFPALLQTSIMALLHVYRL